MVGKEGGLILEESGATHVRPMRLPMNAKLSSSEVLLWGEAAYSTARLPADGVAEVIIS